MVDARKVDHIARAFEDLFYGYIDQRWGEAAFLPPPASFDMWEDEARYVVCTRFSFDSGATIDLSFTASAFRSRDFAFVDAPGVLALWSKAYAERVKRDFQETLHEIRRAVSANVLFGDCGAPNTLSSIQPLFPRGFPERLSEAGKAIHRGLAQVGAWAWRPSLDVFTRANNTPAALMTAVIRLEGPRNPLLLTACDAAQRAVELARLSPLSASWAESIRAVLAQVFPVPGLEQAAAIEIALADPHFCDPRPRPVSGYDARRIYREPYEQRWDLQDIRAAQVQRAEYYRFDPRPIFREQPMARAAPSQEMQLSNRRIRQLSQQLTAQMERQALVALMGERPIPHPGDLSAAQLAAMQDAALYGMGVLRTGHDLARGTDLSVYLRALYGNYRARETAAGAKAEKLLRENLSPAQLSQLDAHGCFDVVGGSSGKTYRITRGRQMNVYQLDKNGRRVRGLCFVPKGNLVAGDVMLTQKLSLELQEREALAVANVF